MEEAHFFLATVCFDSRQLQKPQLKIRRGNCPLKKFRDQIDQSLELDHQLKGVLIPQYIIFITITKEYYCMCSVNWTPQEKPTSISSSIV